MASTTINCKAQCMIDNCSVVAKIQQFYLDKAELESKLTIQFEGDIQRNAGDLKSLRIVDSEKEK